MARHNKISASSSGNYRAVPFNTRTWLSHALPDFWYLRVFESLKQYTYVCLCGYLYLRHFATGHAQYVNLWNLNATLVGENAKKRVTDVELCIALLLRWLEIDSGKNRSSAQSMFARYQGSWKVFVVCHQSQNSHSSDKPASRLVVDKMLSASRDLTPEASSGRFSKSRITKWRCWSSSAVALSVRNS